jgi:hypothetical protein
VASRMPEQAKVDSVDRLVRHHSTNGHGNAKSWRLRFGGRSDTHTFGGMKDLGVQGIQRLECIG